MDEPELGPGQEDQTFSWERWLVQGLKALRRTLFRYDFGLPDAFWRHLEQAAHELLAAARIFFRTLRDRRRGRKTTTEESRGEIEIDWE